MTQFFSEHVRKTIDRFHFVNHIDLWCIQNCDPNKVKELEGVNTEVCEQLFNKVNSHSNCKSMNESRYFLFWLYNLDLHNLDIEDLTAASDPRTEYRWLKVRIKEVDLTEISKMKVEDRETNDLENLTEKIKSLEIDEQTLHVCEDCGSGFTSKGFLDKHKEKKHGEILKPFMCSECNKILKSKRNLEDHVNKLHRSCKSCSKKFENSKDLEEHRRTHTTCSICDVDMKTKYKLDRHMKSHNGQT